MKYYNIKVNGKNYQVEVEELAVAAVNAVSPEDVSGTTPPVATLRHPATSIQDEAESAAPAIAGAGTTPVKAPMPGTILDVKVELGQDIAANTVLCILEAMKMENEIIFPHAGKVVQVAVKSGKTVNAGDLLFSVQE